MPDFHLYIFALFTIILSSANIYFIVLNLKYKTSGKIFYICSPQKIIYLENMGNLVIYEENHSKTDYHEDMQKLFLPENQTHNFFYGISSLVNKFFKFLYEIMNIVANRERKRHILNFKILVESIRQHFTSIKWDVLNCSFSNITQLAPIIASAKFFFSPCGSNIHNCVLMHEYTGVCLAMSEKIDWPNYVSLYIAKLWTLGFRNPNLIHHNPKGGNCSITNALFCIGKVLYAIDNQKWPENESFVTLFNINKTKQILQYYQKTFIAKVNIYNDYLLLEDLVIGGNTTLNMTLSM